MLKWGNVVSHVSPPSCVTAVSRPLAPPFDHRSCCHTATRFMGSVGLASTQGSSSALRKFVPPAASPEILQPANGLATDTTVNGLRVNMPAAAGAAMTRTNAAARVSSRITTRERIRRLLARPGPALPRAGAANARGYHRTAPGAYSWQAAAAPGETRFCSHLDASASAAEPHTLMADETQKHNARGLGPRSA